MSTHRSFEDILALAKPREETVTLCLDGSLAADADRLIAQLNELDRPGAFIRLSHVGLDSREVLAAFSRTLMNITNVFGSSIGKKFIMAITGLALFVFVALHMVGNLQVFLGPEALNRYGAFLQGNVELLWPARIGLIVLVLLHIWAAVKLSAENRAARPTPYAQHEIVAASYASRTMLMSGLIIAAFVVYHLLHFTVQVPAVNLAGRSFAELHDTKGRHDIFAMMVLGFQRPIVSIFYVIAMALLFMHLSHGLSAMFQSLGFKSPTYGPLIARFAAVASWLIFLGYILIPISILLGYGGKYVEALK